MNNHLSLVYVEDDATSREVMEILLKHIMGIASVVIFEDSTDIIHETLCAARQTRPDPAGHPHEPLDGFAILKELRAHDYFRDTTVVAVTASVMNEEVEMLKTAGFDGGIAKPIRPDLFPTLTEPAVTGGKSLVYCLSEAGGGAYVITG